MTDLSQFKLSPDNDNNPQNMTQNQMPGPNLTPNQSKDLHPSNSEINQANKKFVENILMQNAKKESTNQSKKSIKPIPPPESENQMENKIDNIEQSPIENNLNPNFNRVNSGSNFNNIQPIGPIGDSHLGGLTISQSQKVFPKPEFSLGLDKFKVTTNFKSTVKFSPINNKSGQNNSLRKPSTDNISEIKYRDSDNNTSDLLSQEEKEYLGGPKKIRNTSYFDNKPQFVKESRRLTVELVKVLRNTNSALSVDDILAQNNLNETTLNQESVERAKLKTMQMLDQIYYNNMNSKQASSVFLHSFINDMDEKNKVNISLLNFLLVPRNLKLKIKENKSMDVLFLCSPRLSTLVGVENYILKFYDDKFNALGGFDVLKIVSCNPSQKNEKSFLIDTFDGEKHRYYDLTAESEYICQNYIKSIHFLKQLVKCKIFK
ncbi:MAG: hypothetical protein MJ252_09655 [archaeon]|nr:hypothetical protein [archaeon]